MLKINALLTVLFITVTVKGVPFAEEWNFPNEKVSGKVKTIIFKHNSGGKTVSNYNEKGELVLREIIDAEGKIKNKTVLKYDDSSKLNFLAYSSQYKTEKPRYIEIAEYNDFGRLKSIKRIQADNGYESDNFITEKITYSGGFLQEIKVKYDSKTVTFNFKFSKDGQLIETSRKEGNSFPKHVKTYSYDKKGNLNGYTRWKNGEQRFGSKITYLYDRSGNWIERTTTNFKYEEGYSQKISSWTDCRDISYYFNNQVEIFPYIFLFD